MSPLQLLAAIRVTVTGARGKSFGDIARQVGSFGAAKTDSDLQVMGKFADYAITQNPGFQSIIPGPANNTYVTVATLAASQTSNRSATLAMRGRAGAFYFDPENNAANVTADPAGGFFIAPASGSTGAAGAWVRATSNPVSPLWFGAIGDGVADDTAAIRRANTVARRLGRLVDFVTAPAGWRITGELDMTGIAGVLAVFDKPIIVDVNGTYPRGYGVMFGDASGDWGAGRSDKTQVLGNLTINASSRSKALSGLYVKGSFLNIGAIRANGFNGTGVRLDSVWDSLIGRISVELSGNLTTHALVMNSTGDTTNATKIGSIQVEQAYHKAIFANLLRYRIENIHSERLTILSADEGNGSYENFYFLLSNSSIDQAVLHARSLTAENPDNRAGPGGEPLATLPDGTSAPPRITMNGDASRYSEFECNGAVVTTNYGTGLNISNLGAMDYQQAAPATRVLLTLPAITRKCEIAADTTIIEPMIDTFAPAFNAKNIIVSGGWITKPLDFPNNILGNIAFDKVTLSNVIGTKSPADGYLPATFLNCTITRYSGAFEAQAKVTGGRIGTVAFASQAQVEMDDVDVGTFGYTGNVAYLTRNVRAKVANGWSVPTNVNYPAGTITERVGYNAAGKIYQNTDGAGSWVAL